MKSFKIPWAAWSEPEYLELTFPDSWDVENCKMDGADGPEMNESEIKQAIDNPIGTPRLSDLAKGKNNAVIVVDDITRPTPVSKIMPIVLEELEIQGSIPKENITILLAVGAHRPMKRHDCLLKLGEDIVNNYNIENHHPYENLTNLGKSSIGTPIDINTTYYKADLKVAIGGVIPHVFAGFGGGAKIVLPGVSGIRTLEANHSAGMKGTGAGIGRMTPIREDIEEIAEIVGLDFSINAILSENGNITAISAGHFRDAHRKAMEIGTKVYNTILPRDNHICFLNAYPEDSELNQIAKAFNLFLTAPKNFLDRKGSIVLLSSSHEGRGFHSLLWERGVNLYKNMGDNILWKAFVRKRPVYLFSPNVSKSDVLHILPETVKVFKEWEGLIKELTDVYGNSPKAAIIPCSMQMPEPPKI